jgi:hypothetical protein
MRQFFVLLLFSSEMLYAQMFESQVLVFTDTITFFEQINEQNSLVKLVDSSECYYTIFLYNTTEDTLYLFDSYFEEDLVYSIYLHRYNTTEQKCKISFLPIHYYLTYQRSDVLIVGKKRINSQFQILYNFTSIYPNHYTKISIPKDVFDYDYIDDYDTQMLSKFIKPIFKKCISPYNCLYRTIEFALYKNIRKLNYNAFYYDEYNFDKNVNLYEIITIDL